MISKEHLKKIVMLAHLEDRMLESLIPISELLQYDEGEYIFRQKEPAKRLFMVLKGKVLLEQRISDDVTLTLGAIKPGYSFGWSSVFEDAEYDTDAICSERSQIISFRSEKLKSLFEADHSLGYLMSQRLLRVIKKRYEIRTEQFIKLIQHHPDIGSLL